MLSGIQARRLVEEKKEQDLAEKQERLRMAKESAASLLDQELDRVEERIVAAAKRGQTNILYAKMKNQYNYVLLDMVADRLRALDYFAQLNPECTLYISWF